MKHFRSFAATALFAAAAMVACSDDDDSPSDTATGGRATSGGRSGTGGSENGEAGEPSTGGKTSAGGNTAAGGRTTGGNGPGSGGENALAGSGGDGGDAGAGAGPGAGGDNGGEGPVELAADCDLSGEDKPRAKIAAEDGGTIFEDGENITLTSDTIWTLQGYVEVREGSTLTIEPCTRIEGTKEPLGVLFVERGGQLHAEGTAERPILFTSAAAEPAAGDWGGVVLLGRAPTAKGSATFEGVMDAPEFTYGGDDAADSSGTLTYVKIEYGGYLFLADKEVNGLSLAGVGRGTTLHHVMVSKTSDDCFEWWGGNVEDADYLICNDPGDDMFDGDEGWVGGGKNWFGRTTSDTAITSGDPNGFEWDSLLTGSEPVTDITASNVTLCGAGQFSLPSYGMVLRELVTAEIDNLVAMGWDFGVDARDTFVDGDVPHVTLESSLFFGLPIVNPADNDGDASPGDQSFDEQAWFDTAGWSNVHEPSEDSAPFTLEDCLAEGGPASAVLESGTGAFKENRSWVRDAWTMIGGGW